MMPKRSLNQKDIIRLLSKLKDKTPEYPADLMAARKAAFLKQAVTLRIEGKGQGGEGGQHGGSSGSGGSGTALGGGTASQGIILQALIGSAIVAAMLLTAFAFREKISEILSGDEISSVNETINGTLLPSGVSTPSANAMVSPAVSGSPTQAAPTGTPSGLESINLNGTPGIESTAGLESILDSSKTNPGLHLGQTPGTPAAPGQGNPGNINQPDKPDKPKPEKPEKPVKPDKPPKPGN